MKQTNKGFNIKAFTPGTGKKWSPPKKTEVKRKMEVEIKQEEREGFDTLGKSQLDMTMKLTQILTYSNPP